MKSIAFLLIFTCIGLFKSVAQDKSHAQNKKPTLVVGIVVDQMRSDYIYRYWDKLSDNGFKKLVKNGFVCSNTQYNYMPTLTAPGHASIYTGAIPAVHGIVGNNWFSRQASATVYCVADTRYTGVGSNARVGQSSPHNMLTTTIGDELRLFSMFRSKVIAISLKDRSAVLPAGHSGKAYWFDSDSGKFISSSYYGDSLLPSWLNNFNAANITTKYLKDQWEPLLKLQDYTESTSDNNRYEYVSDTAAGALPVFNYDMKKLRMLDPEIFRNTPFGNTVTMEAAMAAITGEQLGEDEFCDLLAVSFASTDDIGHAFGTHAIEMQDTYLRLDKDIARFLEFLEKKFGRNVLVFLTADHGAVPNPNFLNDNKLPGGFVYSRSVRDQVKETLKSNGFDTAVFSFYINNQVYLNYDIIRNRNYNKDEVLSKLADELQHLNYVADVLRGDDIKRFEYIYGVKGMVSRGYNQKRSGDLMLVYQPGFIKAAPGIQPEKGTDHGAPYRYDTMVPLIWYGWEVKPGKTSRHINITDIAPTISDILNICQPSGCSGEPVIELFMR